MGLYTSFIEEQCQKEQLRRDSFHIAIVLAPSGKVKWFSKDSAAALGYEQSELEQVLACNPIHPDDIDRVRAQFQQLFRESKRVQITCRCRKKDGEFVKVHSEALPVYKGKIIEGYLILSRLKTVDLSRVLFHTKCEAVRTR